MRVLATHLYLLVAVAASVIAMGIASVRSSRLRTAGWTLLLAGLGVMALLVLLQITGRLGPEHLWFRSPAFYVAATILAAVGAWWIARPVPAALRFGLPALVLGGIASAATVAGIAGSSAPVSMLMPTLNARAPELSYFDETGSRRTLAELRGQVVLLNFWATWCTPCRREMPMLSRLQRSHAEQGLVVLYVSLEEPEVLGPFLAANRFDGVQGRLDRAADFYDAGKFYPLSFLISRDGRVANRWSGRPREDWLNSQVAAQL